MENEKKPEPIKPMTCKKQSDDVDWFLGQKIVTRYCRVDEKNQKLFYFEKIKNKWRKNKSDEIKTFFWK